MPMIDVTYPEGTLTAGQRGELTEQLMTVLLRAERAPDTEFFHNATWIYVHELPADCVTQAGKPVAAPTFRIEITTPEGALSDRRRQELVAEATRVVREIAGIPEEEGLRIWVLLKEIFEGGWGAGGHVIAFKQLAEIAKAERDKAEAPA